MCPLFAKISPALKNPGCAPVTGGDINVILILKRQEYMCLVQQINTYFAVL